MKKKVDIKIKTLIENGLKTRQRTFFVIIGDRGRDQVRLLSKLRHRANTLLGCKLSLPHVEDVSQNKAQSALVLQKRTRFLDSQEEAYERGQKDDEKRTL